MNNTSTRLPSDLDSLAAMWTAREDDAYAPDTITDGWEWDDLVDPLDFPDDFDVDPWTMRPSF